MATLYISYLSGAEKGVAQGIVGSVTLTTSGTSADVTVPSGVGIVSVYSDAAHYVAQQSGDTVTAAAGNSIYVPAGQIREIKVDSGFGRTMKIAAITA